ncbi:MAG: hypothetical protein V3T70_08000, partial [Phycisphaerae bacterium]
VLAAAADRWRIVFFHHPVYTAGKYQPAYRLREALLPVIERHGAALVLAGHNHMYERSHPMRGGQIVPPGRGTVHVTTGAGGDELYAPRAGHALEIAAQDATQHSFTVIDVTPESLTVRQLNRDGDVIDECLIPAPETTSP